MRLGKGEFDVSEEEEKTDGLLSPFSQALYSSECLGQGEAVLCRPRQISCRAVSRRGVDVLAGL
jgi:hypothetical protein